MELFGEFPKGLSFGRLMEGCVSYVKVLKNWTVIFSPTVTSWEGSSKSIVGLPV